MATSFTRDLSLTRRTTAKGSRGRKWTSRAIEVLHVVCDGAAEELALLGGLCGAPAELVGWTRLDVDGGEGMGVVVGDGPHLMIYALVDGHPQDDVNVAGELAYAAYVRLDPLQPGSGSIAETQGWRSAETVTSGEVRTEEAFFVACSQSWLVTGTFVWSSATITATWSAANAC